MLQSIVTSVTYRLNQRGDALVICDSLWVYTPMSHLLPIQQCYMLFIAFAHTFALQQQERTEFVAMASSSLSAWRTMSRRTRRIEERMLRMREIRNVLPQLSSFQSCAMIGCGAGAVELAFVRECFPNLTELAAVEPDADMMADLKTNVSQLIPTVSVDFYQETAESWAGFSGKLFDAVLMFHCLYYVPPSERPGLFKKLFDHVLVSGGVVIILLSVRDLQNRKGFHRLLRCLDIDGVQICDTMTSVGFEDCYQLEIECQLDVQEPNDDLMSAIMFMNEDKLSLEEVRRAVKEEFGDKKIVPHENWFGVFRKP